MSFFFIQGMLNVQNLTMLVPWFFSEIKLLFAPKNNFIFVCLLRKIQYLKKGGENFRKFLCINFFFWEQAHFWKKEWSVPLNDIPNVTDIFKNHPRAKRISSHVFIAKKADLIVLMLLPKQYISPVFMFIVVKWTGKMRESIYKD